MTEVSEPGVMEPGVMERGVMDPAVIENGAQAADAALKAKHRAMWALGDYPAVAREIIAPLGPILVEAAGVGTGDRVLDVAAGSGNVAIPAAQTGASVVASDLTPELLEVGRALVAAEGLALTWETGDTEALPYEDGSFDAVLSCVGVMFAPHHQVAADELVRVCRSGGTIGLINWTPEGFIEAHGQPLRGAGRLQHYFKNNYGPTFAVYRSIADQPERVAALDADLADLARRLDVGTGSTVLEWEYLLITATVL